MSKVLYIIANPNNDSIGVKVGDAFINELKRINEDIKVTTVNLFDTYVPELDGDTLAAWGDLAKGKGFPELTERQQRHLSGSDALLNQFLEHDKYIFVTPLWNSNVPVRFHSYLDALCVPQKTFKYTEQGPEGLVKNKKAIHIHASGKLVQDGEIVLPLAIVREVMNLIGISDYHTLLVHGQQQERERADEIREDAIAKAIRMAKKF
ncbi:MAG: NAD(P)H-dependent oxidoreductase [Defluviitaleaceae bacterium]|nr:NAD(P)H-dependent oxidoreductase [Defluviitaleaceae bacterium]